MPAKFTSDVKGRIVNRIEASMEEANRLMDDDSKTFYLCPGIAPRGFVDFCAGMTIFPTIGNDGKVAGTVCVYEVMGEWHAVIKGMECGHCCGAVYDGDQDGWEPLLVGGNPSARCPDCSARVRASAAYRKIP